MISSPTAPNPNKLMAQLRMMPDQQLVQYAQMHKNDPYIFPMAFQESNTRKQMRAVQNAQAAPAPKVVDQNLQEMAQPMIEEQGIAALPAPNMQNMAGGGIVAFDDGGEVPGYAGGVFTGTLGDVPSGAIVMGNMYQDPVTGKMIPIPQRDALPFGNVPINYAENKRLYEEKKQADLAARTAVAQSVLNESPEAYAARKVAELEAQGGNQLSPDARNMAMSQFVKDKIAGQVKRGEAGYTTESQLLPSATTYTGTPQPGVTPPGKEPLAKAPSAEDAYTAGINTLLKDSQAGGAGISRLDAKRYSFTPEQLTKLTPADFAQAVDSAMPKNPTASPFDVQQKELNRANTEARQNSKKELEQQFEKQGLAFKGTLEKLTSKEARVKTMEDNQLGVSMFEAGLAMMAGESPHAMINFGKGAQVGTKKYAEIQDKVEGARDKIDETKMKIEEFRRNEANMNSRELRAAQRDIDDSVSAGAQSMITLAREQYGLNKQQALSFFTNSQVANQFNVSEKNKAAAQNQQTAANIDTAYAQMANQASIAERARSTQLGIAGLEAKYRKENPQAGSLGFFREIGKGDPVKGMEIYSRSLGPEAKGDEALVASYIKNPTALMALETTDPKLAAQIKQKIQMQLLQPLTKPGDVNRP